MKSLRLFATLVALLSCMAVNAEVKTGSCGENLTYTLDTNTGVLKIEGSGEMYNFGWEICPWSQYEDIITNIVFSNEISSIGVNAFYNCSALNSVTIPNSVTFLGDNAFYNCSGLTSVTIPNSVTSIGQFAFDGCYFQKDKFVNKSSCKDDWNWGATLCDLETQDGLLINNNVVIRCRNKGAPAKPCVCK